MRILVTAASKHGSTAGIASAIATELMENGLDVDLRDPNEVRDTAGYGAIIVGSGVYMGRWLSEARAFVEQHQDKLAGVPVWLFSSGPLGLEDPQPEGDPPGTAELLRATGARGHRTFAGKLDASELSLGERLITKVIHPPAGDFRDWEAIRSWATEIASKLHSQIVTP